MAIRWTIDLVRGGTQGFLASPTPPQKLGGSKGEQKEKEKRIHKLQWIFVYTSHTFQAHPHFFDHLIT